MRPPEGHWLFCDIPTGVRAPQSRGHTSTWHLSQQTPVQKMGATELQDEILGKVAQQEITWSPHGVPHLSFQENQDEGKTGDMLRHAMGREGRGAKSGSR